MKSFKAVCVWTIACAGLSACSPSWHPFGYSSKAHDLAVTQSKTYDDAMAALEAEDFEGALLRLQSLSRSYRESPAALNGLALAYAGLGQNDKAVFMFERALEAEPYNSTAMDGLERLGAVRSSIVADARGKSSGQETEASAMKTAAMDLADDAAQATIGSESMPQLLVGEPGVVVLNGNGRIGNADAYASLFKRNRLKIEKVGRADRFDYTQSVIRYRPGTRDAAEFIGKTMAVDPLYMESSEDGQAIVVIVGEDAV